MGGIQEIKEMTLKIIRKTIMKRIHKIIENGAFEGFFDQ